MGDGLCDFLDAWGFLIACEKEDVAVKPDVAIGEDDAGGAEYVDVTTKPERACTTDGEDDDEIDVDDDDVDDEDVDVDDEDVDVDDLDVDAAAMLADDSIRAQALDNAKDDDDAAA